MKSVWWFLCRLKVFKYNLKCFYASKPANLLSDFTEKKTVSYKKQTEGEKANWNSPTWPDGKTKMEVNCGHQ